MVNFKTMPFVLSVCVVLAAALASCSVKENRNDCPCSLMLDFSEVDSVVVKSVNILAVSDDGIVFYDIINSEAFSETYVRKVPHGNIHVNVWAGDRRGLETDRIVHIPYGLECPPVYMHSFVADTRGESCEETVLLNKNHCCLTVMMPDGSVVPYSLTFKGSVDGYDMVGNPANGEFSCVAYPQINGDSMAVIPRQVDNSLMLEVDDGQIHQKMFAIGEYLDKSGYDWTAASLADVTLVLDYSLTSVTIQIAGWDKEGVYNVVL